MCRKYGAKKRQQRREKRAREMSAQSGFGLELARRVALLESRLDRFVRILRAQYIAGYQVGQKAERQRWRNMPRDWDARAQPLDIEDKKLHFHRVAGETDGD